MEHGIVRKKNTHYNNYKHINKITEMEQWNEKKNTHYNYKHMHIIKEKNYRNRKNWRTGG